VSKSAQVWLSQRQRWLGSADQERDSVLTWPHSPLVVPYCCQQLAGRTAERLFVPDFDLTAGLDELVFANIMVMGHAFANKQEAELWWSYTLQRTERNLRDNEGAVRQIADVLLTNDHIEQDKIAVLTKGVVMAPREIVVPADIPLQFDPIEIICEEQDGQ
jgi:hypothetical protein